MDRSDTTSAGISMGAALAMILSFSKWHSIIWASYMAFAVGYT